MAGRDREYRDDYDEFEYADDTEERSARSRGRRSSSASGTRAAKKKAGKKRGKILLFVVEIIVLIVMLVVLYAVTRGTENVAKVNIKEEDIIINEEVKISEETGEMKGYRNIALFGVDSRTGSLTKNTRSDTIIIASVNLDTGDIKLCSVYRDTYLNLSNDTYNKCNAAYAKGGPEQAMNMLNLNLDMNITDFVTIGFEGLSKVIDALGGVEIDVDSAEIDHLNNYQYTMAEDLQVSYTKVEHTGMQNLNGLQATAYCRIRYTAGDDFKRAERQREVLKAVMDKAKQADVATLTKAVNSIFDAKLVYTSLGLDEILELLKDVGKYRVASDDGFPQADMRDTGTIGGGVGSSVIPLDLYNNVIWLHKYLFGDENYTPSADVKRCSEKVAGTSYKK